MEPLIDQPPFVQALEQHAAAEKRTRRRASLLSPAEIHAALLTGKCAMGITWPGRLTESESQPKATALLRLSVAARFPVRTTFSISANRGGKNERMANRCMSRCLAVSGRLGSIAKRHGQITIGFEPAADVVRFRI